MAIAATLVAFSIVAASQAPASVPPGLYKVEPQHTRVLFAVSRFGLTPYRGEFIGASGTLILSEPDVGASRLEVSAPISGLTTPSRYLDTWLAGPGWFDAARYPTMTFRSTAIAPTGADTADVTGDLTLHGVTRSVIFKAKFNAGGFNLQDQAYAVGFEARGRIRRSDFGIGRFAFLVGDHVDLIISAAFERAHP
jgi:polyisoprenoid-binding protein YceI